VFCSTFFKVADANKISKRKKQEVRSAVLPSRATRCPNVELIKQRIEPLFNKYEKPDEWRLSKLKRATRSSQTFG
jgi:ATP-dependent RNA helicase DHX8/PRP22